jgi:serine phosphatase RsbU (regulator of sigma subunit)
LLLFVTDGFFEWARRDEQLFGLARLRQTVLQLVEAPIDELIPAIYAQVEKFAEGAAQEDDVTAVVVRRCAHPSRV